MDDSPVKTDALNYNEPNIGTPNVQTPLDEVFGRFPMETGTPTRGPRLFRDGLGFDTNKTRFYYYDFTNQVWKTVYGVGSRLIFELKVMDDTTVLTTGDGKIIFCIPSEYTGLDLTNAQAFVTTVSSSGTPTIQIRNVTDSVDMLSTKITIDASEFTSYTAATPAVIDTTKDDVVTGDLLAVDVDVAGTGAKGLGVILTFS
jgi:hypothetical protein